MQSFLLQIKGFLHSAVRVAIREEITFQLIQTSPDFLGRPRLAGLRPNYRPRFVLLLAGFSKMDLAVDLCASAIYN